jgi:peptidoglycan/LPS O-acetylase OafA/YrhL
VLFFVLKLAGHRGTVANMLPHSGAGVLYLHSIFYRDMSSINPVAWPLEPEVRFYIPAPVLALVFAVRKTWLRRAAIAACIVLAAVVFPWVDIDPPV